MKLKHAILEQLDRDRLKAVVEQLELEGVDRRSREDMMAALSRAHRATPEVLIESLYEDEVKVVCELVGVDATGRRNQLIRRLVRREKRLRQTTKSDTQLLTEPAHLSDEPPEPPAAWDDEVPRTADSRSFTTMDDDIEHDATTRDIRTAAPVDQPNASARLTASQRRARALATGPAGAAPTPSAPPTEPPARLPEPPPGMLRVTKTELVWPGKYNEDGTLREVPRVSLPFQVIERIGESRATREARKARGPTLFDMWEREEAETFEAGWRNKLIWGDNLLVMGSLLEQFAGKIDLIYIDPPFATGADFSFRALVGEEEIIKDASMMEEKAYRDTWGRGLDSFLQMLFDRFTLMRDLLSDDGTMYVHIGWDVSHYVKCVLDGVFGRKQFVNQIIWKRQTAHSDIGQGSKHMGPIHDVILLYAKSDDYCWNMQYTPYSEDYVNAFYKHVEPETGRRYRLSDATAPGGAAKGNPFYEFLGVTRYWRFSRERMEELYRQGRIVQTKPGTVPAQKRYLDEMPGVPIQDLWLDINMVQPQSRQRLGYDTQKPEELVTRVIEQSSSPDDLVADFFSGSGTAMAVAEKLGRRWIACDLSRWAIHVTRKRLLEIENCKPFEVLNLGKYERQYWQGVTFGHGHDQAITEQALFEYLAFILRLYGAQPVPGLVHLHGKKGHAMVHIGAVDAPVTIDEISQAIDECAHLKQPELHVLGWEWEMGLAGPNNEYRKGGLMQDDARQRGVKLVLFQIPREVMEQQAVDKGDIQFFELAYLDLEIRKPKRLTLQVTLKDFVIPNTELVPEDVRAKIKKWSDYIDYWAIDWDFQNDTFMQGWVAYRTRRERKLPLTSDPHTYERPGKYRVLIKVIDIFGNDTSQAHTVEVG